MFVEQNFPLFQLVGPRPPIPLPMVTRRVSRQLEKYAPRPLITCRGVFKKLCNRILNENWIRVFTSTHKETFIDKSKKQRFFLQVYVLHFLKKNASKKGEEAGKQGMDNCKQM